MPETVQRGHVHSVELDEQELGWIWNLLSYCLFSLNVLIFLSSESCLVYEMSENEEMFCPALKDIQFTVTEE